MKKATRRDRVTLAAILALLQERDRVFIVHRMGPHECEGVAGGTVRELQSTRCVEVCGDNVVEGLTLDLDQWPEIWPDEGVSTCKGCGAPIDWITTKEGKYMPVDPEPVFIIEGGGSDRFVTDEGEVLLGRRVLAEEEKPGLEVAFVPHWKTCPDAGRFRRNRGRRI